MTCLHSPIYFSKKRYKYSHWSSEFWEANCNMNHLLGSISQCGHLGSALLRKIVRPGHAGMSTCLPPQSTGFRRNKCSYRTSQWGAGPAEDYRADWWRSDKIPFIFQVSKWLLIFFFTKGRYSFRDWCLGESNPYFLIL